MAVNKTYKEGGSGKGQAVRVGLNLTKYGENLDKAHGTRQKSCLDCVFFRGVPIIDVVTCLEGKKQVGLRVCSDFINA